MILEYFSLERAFYRTLGKARKIHALLLYDYHLLLENEWNALRK
jgi:hypothetical protein